jgi:hypothetical protein
MGPGIFVHPRMNFGQEGRRGGACFAGAQLGAPAYVLGGGIADQLVQADHVMAVMGGKGRKVERSCLAPPCF